MFTVKICFSDVLTVEHHMAIDSVQDKPFTQKDLEYEVESLNTERTKNNLIEFPSLVGAKLFIRKKNNLSMVRLNFPVVVKENDVLEICWRCTLNLFSYGAGIKSTTGKKSLGTVDYSSNTPFAYLLKNIRHDAGTAYQDSDAWLTESQMFTPGALIPSATELNVFLVSKNDSYSNIQFPQLAMLVDFEFLMDSSGNVDVTVLDRNFIDYFENLSNEPLYSRIKKFNESEDFLKLCDELLRELNVLSETYRPTTQGSLCVAARRLIINEVLKRACHYTKTSWAVEDNRFSYKSKGTVGWGPLDFTFERETTIIKGSDLDEEEMEELKKRKLESSIESPSKDSLDGGSNPVTELVDIEAKYASAKQGMFQLAAQLYDLGVFYQQNHPTVTQFEMRGILSTGRTWRFFSLIFHSQKLPLMKFEGQVVLHAIKSPEFLPTSRPKRRFSGLYVNERVSPVEVNNILKAVIVSMN